MLFSVQQNGFLSENNRIFFSGKNKFAFHERYVDKLWHLGNDDYVARQPFEIENFQFCCKDREDNVIDELVDIAAGTSHFVVLTGEYPDGGWTIE